jgi:hypothetical protein
MENQAVPEAGVPVVANGLPDMAQLIAALQQVAGMNQQHRPVTNKPPTYRQGQDFVLWLERFNLYINEVNVLPQNRRTELMKFLDLDTAFKAAHSMDLDPELTFADVCVRLTARFARYSMADDAKMAFQVREQLATESMEDYVDFLSKLCREAYPDPTYNNDSRSDLVFERFRRGVRTAMDIRERLFTERPAGVRAALTLIRNIELGRKQFDGDVAQAQLKVTRDELQGLQSQIASFKKQMVVGQTSGTNTTSGVCKQQGLESPFCVWCGSNDHYAVNCRVRIASSGSTPGRSPLKCYACGGGEHFARDCPNRTNGSPMQSAPAMSGNKVACFQCGGPHWKRDCPMAMGSGNGVGRSAQGGSRSAQPYRQ